MARVPSLATGKAQQGKTLYTGDERKAKKHPKSLELHNSTTTNVFHTAKNITHWIGFHLDYPLVLRYFFGLQHKYLHPLSHCRPLEVHLNRRARPMLDRKAS